MKASEKFVRLIVRRPHAYELKEKDKNVAIPGITFLDTTGKSLGNTPLHSAEKLLDKMNELTR